MILSYQKLVFRDYFGDDEVHVKTFDKHPAESAQEKQVHENCDGKAEVLVGGSVNPGQ
jgi:hypothetical protein